MRTPMIVVATISLLAVAADGTAAVTPALSGTWRSAPDRTQLTTDLQKSIWGPNAESVRTVSLVVRASGDAVLTVTTKIVDGKGRTAAGSTAIEEARLTIGDPQEPVGVRTDYAVTVVRAERRYPDTPADKWPIEGLRVKIATIDGQRDRIELRVDTPEGTGSFWETLRKGSS